MLSASSSIARRFVCMNYRLGNVLVRFLFDTGALIV
jgi:hypothetical protein